MYHETDTLRFTGVAGWLCLAGLFILLAAVGADGIPNPPVGRFLLSLLAAVCSVIATWAGQWKPAK